MRAIGGQGLEGLCVLGACVFTCMRFKELIKSYQIAELSHMAASQSDCNESPGALELQVINCCV